MAIKIINILAFAILFVGGLNWALIGLFDFNLVSMIFGGYRAMGSVIVYIAVGVSALWLLLSSLASSGRISFVEEM